MAGLSKKKRAAREKVDATQSYLIEDALGLVREDDRIAIKSKAQLVSVGATAVAGHQRRGRHSTIQRIAHILSLVGQEQLAAESVDVAPGALATTESGSIDGQSVVLDRIEDTQAGIGAVA